MSDKQAVKHGKAASSGSGEAGWEVGARYPTADLTTISGLYHPVIIWSSLPLA